MNREEGKAWQGENENTAGDNKTNLHANRDNRDKTRHDEEIQTAFNIINRSPVVAFRWKNEPGWPASFVTSNVKDMLGYDATDFTSARVSYEKIIYPEDLEKVAGEVKQHSSDPRRDSFVHAPYRIITRDGNIRWIEDRTYIYRDKDGKIQFYEGILTDITKRMEAYSKLAESEKKFRSLFEGSRDGIFLFTKEGHILDCNRAFIEMLGYSRESLCHINFYQLIPGHYKDWEKNEIIEKQLFGRGLTDTHEIELLHYKGKVFPVELRLHTFAGEDGGISFLWGVARDITARKQTEHRLVTQNEEYASLNEEYVTQNEELRSTVEEMNHLNNLLKNSEERFKALFENALTGIFYINTKGDILEANPKIVEILGSPSIEATKKINVFNFKPLLEVGYADDMKKCLLTGESIFGNARYTTKWGKEIYARYYFAPICQNEQVVGVLANIEDVTDMKMAERALKQSEREFRSLTENSRDYIMRYDRQGRHLYMNKAGLEITGIKAGDIIGKTHRESGLFPDHLCKLWEEHIDLAIMSRRPVKRQFAWKSAKGTVTLDWMVIPEFDENNEVVSLLGVSRDISEFKKVQDDLIKAKEIAEASNKIKTAFLQNMSHEIRTPLNGVLGFADLLKKDGLPSLKREQYAGIIQKSGKQLLFIVDDIIRISSIDTGKEKANNSPVKVHALLKELKTIFENEARNKDIRFHLSVSLPHEDYMVYTDHTKLFQVLSNLLTNAVKFTEKGAIQLGCRMDGEHLIFRVKDTGIGILKENQANIFERFWQEGREPSKKVRGTGLGLSICKAYVELLGGKIWLESEKEKGSSFYFTIPNQILELAHQNTVPSAKDKYNWKGKKILVAEDEQVNYIYLEELLSNRGIQTVHARDGLEAVENVKKSDFDLILMDIKMPVMNGFDATSQILSLKPYLTIIAQTAYTDAEEKEKAFTAGCKAFITKPITEESLLQEIQKYLV